MQKKTHDYDNVFKTMKSKHKRLFISVINDIFGKTYPMDAAVDALPSEGYLTESETADGRKEIEELIPDFLIRIRSDVYLLECQSYDDGSVAIRIAEYAFIAARQSAAWDAGHAVIPMPAFAIIYVKRTNRTPKTTAITFTFPDGQSINYASDNVILEDLTKEYIVEKRLFPYIPFYIARYEKRIYATVLRTRCAERTRAMRLVRMCASKTCTVFLWTFVSGKRHEGASMKRRSYQIRIPAGRQRIWLIPASNEPSAMLA